jgi:hypothetical protein
MLHEIREVSKALTIALTESTPRTMVRINKNGHLNQSHGLVRNYACVLGWRVRGQSGQVLAREET